MKKKKLSDILSEMEIGVRNLITNLPDNWEKGYYHTSSGVSVPGSANHIKLKDNITIEALPNTNYVLSGKKRLVILEYRADNSFIGMINKPEGDTVRFKSSSQVSYFRSYALNTGEDNNPLLVNGYEFKLSTGIVGTDFVPAWEDLL